MRRAVPTALLLTIAASAAAQAPPAEEPQAAPPAPVPAPAPETPAQPPPAPATPEPGAEQPAPPAPGPAPPGYYVEGAPGGQASPARPAPPVYEPPPPGMGPIYEPPPPPVARHVAPRTAFWVGLRLGWFVPFGHVYAQVRPTQLGFTVDRVPWSDYASSGLMLEGDIGARLGRHYNVFAFWERAQLGSGDAENDVRGGQDGSDSDFWGIGLRASSDADDLGLLTELALGYRQARATWEDGSELQFTDGVLEGRIGFGADIRLNRTFSISPLVTLGVGSFGKVRRVFPNGSSAIETQPGDESDSHAWLTLGIGGHADLFGTK